MTSRDTAAIDFEAKNRYDGEAIYTASSSNG